MSFDMDMVSFLLRMLGFVLIFAGAAVAAAFGSPSGGCFGTISSSTALGCEQGIANAVITGRILLAIGAFLLGAGAGLKLRFVLKRPTDGGAEAMAWVMVERVFNYAVLAAAILLLWWAVSTVSLSSLVSIAGTGGGA
jgi:hypothetical protein